jgi:uncharacterized membrane protein
VLCGQVEATKWHLILNSQTAYRIGFVKPIFRMMLLIMLLSSVAAAKDFKFAKIEQDVYLQASGQVRVAETYTYDFQGTYRNAFVTIDPASNGFVTFEKVEALDGKAFYGSSIEGNNVKWQYEATDERRVFRITYTLTNELKVSNDAAQFDRQVLYPDHKDVDQYIVRIHAPKPNPSLFRVFVFNSRSRIGKLDINTAKGIATININPVGEGEFVRTRVFLAPNQFTFRNVSGNTFSTWIEEVRRETQGFRDASSAAIKRGSVDTGGFAPPPPPPPAWQYGLPFLPVLLLGGFVWTRFQKFGREPEVQDIGPYYREPAQDIPASFVPFVVTQFSPGVAGLGAAISATLIDFTRKGYLSLLNVRHNGVFGFGARDETHFKLEKQPDEKLSPFEAELWNLIEAAHGGDGILSPSELKTYFQRRSSLATTLSALPRESYEQQYGQLLDQSSETQKVLTIVVGAIGAIICFTVAFFFSFSPTITVALVVVGAGSGILTAVAGATLSKWNADKLLNARKWLAYKHFLSDFSQMKTAPPEHFKLWDYHFVYATALGVATQYIGNIKRMAESNPSLIPIPYWMGGGGYDKFGNALSALESINSLSDIASNLGNLNSALSDISSGSGGGFGGSSSGGSSGGGGSSGAS